MIKTDVEALLFASAKPISAKSIAKILEVKPEEVQAVIETLKGEKNVEGSGIHLIDQEGMLQLVTNPASAPFVAQLSKEEFMGELTRPQLETLSIICYRGPVTKPEIEQIRGVNCSLIIRNLMIRGLIEEREDVSRLQPVYTASLDFVRHLGVDALSALPEFGRFHDDVRIGKLLEDSAGVEPAVE